MKIIDVTYSFIFSNPDSSNEKIEFQIKQIFIDIDLPRIKFIGVEISNIIHSLKKIEINVIGLTTELEVVLPMLKKLDNYTWIEKKIHIKKLPTQNGDAR